MNDVPLLIAGICIQPSKGSGLFKSETHACAINNPLNRLKKTPDVLDDATPWSIGSFPFSDPTQYSAVQMIALPRRVPHLGAACNHRFRGEVGRE